MMKRNEIKYRAYTISPIFQAPGARSVFNQLLSSRESVLNPCQLSSHRHTIFNLKDILSEISRKVNKFYRKKLIDGYRKI